MNLAPFFAGGPESRPCEDVRRVTSARLVQKKANIIITDYYGLTQDWRASRNDDMIRNEFIVITLTSNDDAAPFSQAHARHSSWTRTVLTIDLEGCFQN